MSALPRSKSEKSMELNPVLERFAQRAPLPVMARAVLERCLNAEELDA